MSAGDRNCGRKGSEHPVEICSVHERPKPISNGWSESAPENDLRVANQCTVIMIAGKIIACHLAVQHVTRRPTCTLPAYATRAAEEVLGRVRVVSVCGHLLSAVCQAETFLRNHKVCVPFQPVMRHHLSQRAWREAWSRMSELSFILCEFISRSASLLLPPMFHVQPILLSHRQIEQLQSIQTR